MTEKAILIAVIIGIALIAAGLLVINSRLRMKENDYKQKIKDWDDTDMIYWKDELRNNF